ncbi:MAG TPA: 23S rRNA (adenine(2503)-C(2))-methyltransferase RlmN [Phycisphaerae bacterium]|mgnify:CR=1 FL=1|jgi:23S rRNA (adenine2503-C2)-methyltransferase|nr:23S rRNA (adenine(2503)-C(2))-methyltransferase RlmN [Phycisphaerae bacterium]HOB74768.1 23S rRNA (adenine(2503)-C(2))-methyltransferase RlmN [Phycisphaerae bacterium]HOJ55228.1 23S rRNA (adenine(2503)-C(2))-methyltransferase RlmN [Phycisphaerae bacterium]HOL27754.1 23S rRNA (adenine(2503)-C(2))-methyltransferase RlmN [Phycisphaerae bacterium]HPP22680.1 23S rRNA (adenine(2503)-C(2))-methyltransferase RlmN [Phycisphaerae bacterium]
MPTTERQHLLGTTVEQFSAFLAEHQEPAYRAKQVFDWVYRKGADSFEVMSNLSKPLRALLAEHWDIYTSTISRRWESSDGTVKLLLEWSDGANSECVLIPEEDRNTACISSQVGCPVGCHFCASGLSGLERQLTAGQIVEQAMRVRQLCERPGEAEAKPRRGPSRAAAPNHDGRLSNIVFMGLGEPLANYANVVTAIRLINSAEGMNIGARKITVSTVGLPSQIMRLANENLQINLAISLHAPNDELRRQIIPWAEKISIDEIVEAARYYFEKTGRELTIEYILLGNLNDQPEHAYELVRLARKMRCNVNLIRYNPVPGLPFERPTSFAAHKFVERLRERGVNAHVRKSRGADIDAACGQLRRASRAGKSTADARR